MLGFCKGKFDSVFYELFVKKKKEASCEASFSCFVNNKNVVYLFENKLCELVKAATPSVELVCCTF